MDATSSLVHFFEHTDAVARGVLGVLLLGSIMSWYLIVSKLLYRLRTQRSSQRFLSAFRLDTHSEDLARLLKQSTRPDPYSNLLRLGLSAFAKQVSTNAEKNGEQTEKTKTLLVRALKRGIEQARAELDYGQTLLATVASSAPYVGLLGTVWGIYHALMAMGLAGQNTLNQVAAPVGEALIMTGMGLAVAIPAAVAYNLFAKVSRSALTDIQAFALDAQHYLSSDLAANLNNEIAKSFTLGVEGQDKPVRPAYEGQGSAA